MIDLSAEIRAVILNTSNITDDLSTFGGEKAVFTRRPIDDDAEYPLIIINPQFASGETDYLNSLQRTFTYDIAVYGKNGSSEEYRAVERIAFAVQAKFARLEKTGLEMPSGWSLTNAVSIGPLPAPTDDNETTGRVITLNLTITEN